MDYLRNINRLTIAKTKVENFEFHSLAIAVFFHDIKFLKAQMFWKYFFVLRDCLFVEIIQFTVNKCYSFDDDSSAPRSFLKIK